MYQPALAAYQIVFTRQTFFVNVKSFETFFIEIEHFCLELCIIYYYSSTETKLEFVAETANDIIVTKYCHRVENSKPTDVATNFKHHRSTTFADESIYEYM